MCLAVPGRIMEIAGTGDFDRVGKVSFGGVIKDVSLAYVPEAAVGDYVIVHVGFALSVVDEEEAERTIALLKELESNGTDASGAAEDET
ncbi:MAG: HypC/HybG/HupF family hydrogenase formation chaperone [Chitinivibrionia bacterium]|nr:HypC/HybG/HupF family hydrogenase formation chaperone [Chitinivibrionia bacterium]